jgi:hypothetical protein
MPGANNRATPRRFLWLNLIFAVVQETVGMAALQALQK